MPLTRDFRTSIRARVQSDAAFRRALLSEAVAHLLMGDLATGKAVLRDYVNATMGFASLAEATSIPPKSLMRMLGPDGNPRAATLLSILTALQDAEGIQLRISAAE